MDEWVWNSAAQPRMNTVLLFVFASIAMVIASIGIYGVLAYSVSQRTGEIGLRMALGSSRGDIFRVVAAEGIRVAITGIGVGLIGAITVGKDNVHLDLRCLRPGPCDLYHCRGGQLVSLCKSNRHALSHHLLK